MTSNEVPLPRSAKSAAICVVVNALTLSGGVKEAVSLCGALTTEHGGSCMLTMWQTRNAVPTTGLRLTALSPWVANRTWAAIQMPWLMIRFFVLSRTTFLPSCRYIFTHYSTYPLAWLVPKKQRYFLVQGVEWNFTSQPWLKRILRAAILWSLRSGRVVVVNDYLSAALRAEGISVDRTYPIWAQPSFLRPGELVRTLDVVMVARHGTVKRLDLYRQFIHRARKLRPQWRLGVISPDVDLCDEMADLVEVVLQNPNLEEMAGMYERSKVFLMLSEQEGFGLPPLEAMAAGCIPICRDSGGVRAYMNGVWSDHLLPLGADENAIFSAVDGCLKRTDLDLLADTARASFLRGLEETMVHRQQTVNWLSAVERGV